MNTVPLVLCRLVLVIAIPTSTVFAQVYQLIDLGMQNASGINDRGQVVGYDWYIGYIYYSSYVWENGASHAIPPLQPGGECLARGINNRGWVVGSSWLPGNSYTRHAFLLRDSIMVDLGTLGGSWSEANAVNDSGIVVGASLLPGDTLLHAFIWRDGLMSDIGTLGGGESGAADINNTGQVVGNSIISGPDPWQHAFLWQNGTMTDLGTLGGPTSAANAIDSAGHIVGTSMTPDTTRVGAGFIWNGGMASIEALMTATDINDRGQVVGAWVVPDTLYNQSLKYPRLWHNGVVTDLESVADTSGGWLLTGASVSPFLWINNRGDIVGTGAKRMGTVDQPHAYLLKERYVFLKEPAGGERWLSGEEETIRWKSGLGQGAHVTLSYTINNGQTWRLIKNSVPADSEQYTWTVPDTFSTQTRILIASSTDVTKNDTSRLFTLRSYVLTKLSPLGNLIPYDPVHDRWGFGNDSAGVWPAWWFNRFDYTGTDPFTGESYLSGALVTDAIFFFARPSDHPDWPSFVNTFSPEVCYYTIFPPFRYPSPTAVMRWASVKNQWGGSCFGFAISNAWAWQLESSFRQTYANFPFYANPVDVTADTNSIPVINELYTHQFGKEHQTYRGQQGLPKTPTQTLNDLKEMLSTDAAWARTLSIMNNGPRGGGHAILPYRLRRDEVQPHLYHVLVYDNSYPQELGAEIIIDTAQNGGNGSWSYALWPGWGGNRGIYLREPAIQYQITPSLQKHSGRPSQSPFDTPDSTLIIHLTAGADVRIRDSSGNVSGYLDSLVTTGVPGTIPLVLDNGTTTPPYGYAMRNVPYAVTLSDFTDPNVGLYFFTGSVLFSDIKSFSIERTGATSGQSDRVFFDGGLSFANPDTAVKTFTLRGAIWGWPQEKAFSVRSLSLSQNDSARVQIINTDGLKISSFDSTWKTYGLDLELLRYPPALSQFAHDDISLEAKSSHIIQPDWPSLNTGDLRILIDRGNDGTIDDSIFVSNQITGVDPTNDRIPSAFALHQNYPNPFNSMTTITFELPVASHVVVKIYNVLGQEVAALVSEKKEAGRYQITWDATGIASGVYFYRLQGGDFVQTRKLVLLR